MQPVRCVIAYDGTDFHGWQQQPELRTVQGELQAASFRLLAHPAPFQGASRTDAGVHAQGQVAVVRLPDHFPAERFGRAINHRLPRDVVVLDATPTTDDFDPSRQALEKLYRYRILDGADRAPEPALERYTWVLHHPLDVDALRAGAAHLVGRYDFAAFATRNDARETTVRTIFAINVHRVGREVHIDVRGDGFLYNQVRIVVGTLMEVGRGFWPPERVAAIRDSRDRAQAGRVAPAAGLCLRWIRYPTLNSTSWTSADVSF